MPGGGGEHEEMVPERTWGDGREGLADRRNKVPDCTGLWALVKGWLLPQCHRKTGEVGAGE